MSKKKRWVTVPERISALGYEQNSPLGNQLAWIVGARARDAWAGANKSPPDLELRRKSCGIGSHCFAIYPPTWMALIDDVISAVAADIQADRARQLMLPGFNNE